MNKFNLSYNKAFMSQAILNAEKAGEKGEVPIGAVLVKNGRVVADSFNTVERDQSVLCHAEMKCIDFYSREQNSWRLSGCDIYITLEPCLMCFGALTLSRVDNIYFALHDERHGYLSLNRSISKHPIHTVNTYHDSAFEEEAKQLIQSFFRKIRAQKKRN